MEIVYAVTTASVQMPSGQQVPVRAGGHWPADDPLVLAHPGLFSADPRYGLTYSSRPPSMDEPPVEQATAGPGETRGRVRRG
jgi:hypothetical protein